MAEFGKWITVITRPLTEEDDGELPQDGQEVLITTKYGYVEKTTFYTDMGCYFEQFEDEDDVLAWMPLPKPYKKEN